MKLAPYPAPVLESITPTIAQEYLKTMVSNRVISDAKIIEYGICMEKNGWVVNGETIKFDADGHLFDGQHRLRASILAGKAFISWVIRGVDAPNAFSTVDVGKTRTHGDIFGLSGYVDENTTSSAAMLVYLYKSNLLTVRGPRGIDALSKYKGTKIDPKLLRVRGNVRHSLTKEELLRFTESIRVQLVRSVRFSHLNMKKMMPKTIVAACHYLFSEKSEEQANIFMRDLSEGAGLGVNDPVHRLRERLIESASSTSKLTRWAMFHLTIKAWNKRRDGEPLRMLRIAEDEAFAKVK